MDHLLRSAVTRDTRYEPTKKHRAIAAINQAIIHARLALTRSFFSKRYTRDNQAPAIIFR
ncbi:MAG: hypothetical protein R3C56_41095 [Pirellulaceae bacterium]